MDTTSSEKREKSEKSEKSEKFDLFKELDRFGKFQTWQYFWICCPLIMTAMTHVNYIFVAENIEHRCKVPVCENEMSTHQTPHWWPENVDSKCSRPVLIEDIYSADSCSRSIFSNVSYEACNEWIYESNNSIVSELDLGCQTWRATLVGSIHNAGMTASMMFTGWLADQIGRKPTIILCSVGGAIGVLKMFISDYYTYLAVEFLESFLASGIYTVAVVLLMEVGGETKRVLAGIVFSSAVYLGEVSFAFIAMGLQYWKTVVLVVYSPLVLFTLYGFVLHEGIRWQMVNRKVEQAKQTFKRIVRENKINISDQDIDALNDEELKSEFHVPAREVYENYKDVLKSTEMMKRLAVTSFCFFTASFIYYGMMVYAVMLPGNKYINFVLVCVASVPGEIVAYFTFHKIGRRVSLQCGFLSSAFFLMAQSYTPDSLSWLKITLFLLGKLGVVVCFTGIFTYSLELFPTSVRGSMIGVGNTAARIGSMLSPLSPLLVVYMESLPTLLFSSTAVIAALLLFITPETMSQPLFDTIAHIEAAKKKELEANRPI